MADFHKGKRFLLLFLFVITTSSFVVNCCYSSIISNEHEEELLEQNNNNNNNNKLDDEIKPLEIIIDRQEIQLEKLESLVKNLTEAVARLELSSSDCRQVVVGSVVEKHNNKHEFESPNSDVTDYDDRFTDDEEEIVVDKNTRVGKKGQSDGVSITKYNPSWSERFRFLSAVKLESEATFINILPFEDYEGFSKYIAVGDEQGTVYIFLLNGDVLVEFHTLSESPITSMLSYMSVFKNESVLVTGHKDGVVLVHRVWEASSNGGDQDWHSLSMKHLHAFPSLEKGDDDDDDSSITILEVHQVGRVRFVLSSDLKGRIRVLRENGTVYGTATTKSRPLAFMRQRLLFLTQVGAGSLDLRSMTVRESECEGLNRSLVTNYVFDPSERSKGYGFTSDEDLVHVVLLGDMMNFKCRVRSKRKFEMHGPLAVQAIKGYLLVVNQGKVFVYNVSSQNYIRVGVPRPLFHASLTEIRSSFLSSRGLSDGSRRMTPLISSDHEKLVVLGLGSGYVGMYRSTLPVFNPEFNTMLWTSPVLLFFLFLFGVWQFFGKKKESLTSWGSDDPFISTSVTTTTGGPSLGVGSDDRPFADSTSRTTDLRDLRGGLRGPTRRYASPSRYPGGTGAAIPFRPNTTDPNFRTSSTDHNFRATTELKYRAPSLEGAGFSKRREPLFSNSQVVEDNIE